MEEGKAEERKAEHPESCYFKGLFCSGLGR